MASNRVKQIFREKVGRSVVKALSYRLIVVLTDFTVVYLFTHNTDVATGFVIVSNVYTTVLYLLHERFWDRVEWGKALAA